MIVKTLLFCKQTTIYDLLYIQVEKVTGVFELWATN